MRALGVLPGRVKYHGYGIDDLLQASLRWRIRPILHVGQSGSQAPDALVDVGIERIATAAVLAQVVVGVTPGDRLQVPRPGSHCLRVISDALFRAKHAEGYRTVAPDVRILEEQLGPIPAVADEITQGR